MGNGIGVDLALGGLPFEESAVDWSTQWEYDAGCVLRTYSAKDLIVMKLFASPADRCLRCRRRDQTDARLA
jgi:hypothetical protein